jgi:hypothetical protein
VDEKCSDKFWPRIRLPRNSRNLLHAANLRHETDGFTSPPKEGVLRIYSKCISPKYTRRSFGRYLEHFETFE